MEILLSLCPLLLPLVCVFCFTTAIILKEKIEEIEKSFDKENCNDFVVDQCLSLPFGVFQDVTFRDCQGLCNEILDCTFFVHYAQDIGVCEIWNSTLGEFEGTCGIHMGPLQPSIQDAPQFCNVTEEPCLVRDSLRMNAGKWEGGLPNAVRISNGSFVRYFRIFPLCFKTKYFVLKLCQRFQDMSEIVS